MTMELEFTAQVCAQLGGIQAELSTARQWRERLAAGVYPVYVPSQFAKVTSGGALVIASPELLAPRDGWWWDVRRITVTGLASSSESVTIYKASTGSSTDAQVNNVVTTLTGPTGVYTPLLGACMLRAKESLSVGGSGLTASETVVLTIDAIAVSSEFIGLHLL